VLPLDGFLLVLHFDQGVIALRASNVDLMASRIASLGSAIGVAGGFQHQQEKPRRTSRENQQLWQLVRVTGGTP
jgi:hypothetical protein